MDPVAFLDRVVAGFALLSDRVPRILSDPRGYPRETMVLAIILSVLLLLLVIAGLVLREWLQARDVRGRMRLRRRPEEVARRALLVVGVAALLGLLVAIAPVVPAAGPACGACHVPGDAVDSWRRSTHSSASCYSCHARPGPLGALEATLRGAGALIGGVPRAVPDSGSCLECHAEVAVNPLVARGIRVSHSEMIDAGMGCLLCHQAVGHGSPGQPAKSTAAPRRVVRPMMNRCVTCHDGKTASGECDVCHVSNPADRSVRPAPVGVTPVRVRCDGCHKRSTEERCVSCHGLEMPHPEEFLRRHAGLSVEDPSLCASCHENASPQLGCACHDEANLHGTYSDWFPRHGAIASVNGRGGCRCHDTGFCAQCHDGDPYE